MTEIQTLLGQLSGNAGWLSAVMTWLLAAQTFAKLVQPRVTEALTRLFTHVLETKGSDDDKRVIALLSSFWYWLLAEVLDVVLRVKLPTLADFEKLQGSLPKPENWNPI